MLGGPLLPRRHACFAGFAADQLMAKFNGRLLPLFLVADADAVALIVIEQGKVTAVRKGAAGKFHRRTHIKHGHIIKKQAPVIGNLLHQKGSALRQRLLLVPFTLWLPLQRAKEYQTHLLGCLILQPVHFGIVIGWQIEQLFGGRDHDVDDQ